MQKIDPNITQLTTGTSIASDKATIPSLIVSNGNDAWSPIPKCVIFAEPIDNKTPIPLICTQIINILQCKAQITRPMAIPVNNVAPAHIPAITWTIHQRQYQQGCLFDSFATASSRHKLFHWHLIAKTQKSFTHHIKNTIPNPTCSNQSSGTWNPLHHLYFSFFPCLP